MLFPIIRSTGYLKARMEARYLKLATAAIDDLLNGLH